MENCEAWDGLALARASERRAVSGIHNLNSFPLILNMPGACRANESVSSNRKTTITILYLKQERIDEMSNCRKFTRSDYSFVQIKGKYDRTAVSIKV